MFKNTWKRTNIKISKFENLRLQCIYMIPKGHTVSKLYKVFLIKFYNENNIDVW